MSRSARLTILAFAGLTLLLVVASAALGWHIGLGVTAVGGAFVIWAALRSSTSTGVQSLDSAETLSAASVQSEHTEDLHPLQDGRPEPCSPRGLLDTATDLFRRLDPDDVVSAALEHAIEAADADTGSVMLLDDDVSGQMRIAKAHGLSHEVVLGLPMPLGDEIASWVLTNRSPVLIEDLVRQVADGQRHDLLVAASVPIADDCGSFGVLSVGSNRYPSQISRSRVADLEAIGRFAATALRNARAVETSNDLLLETIKALALALESRDPYAHGGTVRVVALAGLLGDAMGLDQGETRTLKLAALLRDIGMSATGEVVSVGDRPLTTVEWGMLKAHTRIAADILGETLSLRAVIPIVFHHHERFDGDGYPEGLASGRIPLGARILSVADSYVAMTSHRPYRVAMSAERAAAEITTNAGVQFDPEVVDAFLDVMAVDGGCSAVHAV